jgi:hypothetical protein
MAQTVSQLAVYAKGLKHKHFTATVAMCFCCNSEAWYAFQSYAKPYYWM